MPPTQITPYTTNEEVADIYADYANPDGSTNWAAIEADIVDGANDYSHDVDDLIVAYITGRGGLPPAMMAPEGFLDNPDAYDHLWTERVLQSLEHLGDAYAGIDHFLEFVESMEADTGGVLADIQRFYEEMKNRPEEEDAEGEEGGAAAQADFFNLMVPEDLEEVRHHFMASGNIGMALLLNQVYSTFPRLDKLSETITEDAMKKFTKEQKKLMKDLKNLGDDPTDTENSYDAQVIGQKLDVIKTVFSIMQQLLKDLAEMKAEGLKTVADLSDKRSQTIDFMIARM